MKLIGTIAATGGTTKSNKDTAQPFNVPARFTVQPDVDVYLVTGTGTPSATAATGWKFVADAIVDWNLEPGEDAVAIIPVSGSGAANAKIGGR